MLPNIAMLVSNAKTVLIMRPTYISVMNLKTECFQRDFIFAIISSRKLLSDAHAIQKATTAKKMSPRKYSAFGKINGKSESAEYIIGISPVKIRTHLRNDFM